MQDTTTVKNYLISDRPLISIGIEPASELGAKIQAQRIRIYWLKRGFDVPTTSGITVSAFHPVTGRKMKSGNVHGVITNMREAKKINEDQAKALLRQAEFELELLA